MNVTNGNGNVLRLFKKTFQKSTYVAISANKKVLSLSAVTF